jgi:hypothetical protein
VNLELSNDELRAAIDEGLNARKGAVGTARHLTIVGQRKLLQEITPVVETLLIECGSEEDKAEWQRINKQLESKLRG